MDELQRRTILGLAREAISVHLESGKQISPPQEDFLLVLGSAFVTLEIDDTLRGCIGSIEPTHPLGQTIIQSAIAAAFRDPRFSPLTREEFDLVHLKVSLLSPFQEVKDVEEIEVGIHGLYITSGHFRGLLLPQVAVEHHWDRETFLKFACHKAGLPSDAWRHSGVRIEIFSAEVFGEDIAKE